MKDQQEHSGAVDGSTAEVTYGFTDGSGNLLRLTSQTTPSGEQCQLAYGSSGSIDDSFNRPASLQIQGEGSNLAEYEYAGLSLIANIAYPQPDCELALADSSATGDAGDSQTGYDRFQRLIDMPWINCTSSAVLAQIAYGYDKASRRKWRQDLTPAASGTHDRFYHYDSLSQVTGASVGTLNHNRTAIGAIPDEQESWAYDETGNWLQYEKAEDGSIGGPRDHFGDMREFRRRYPNDAMTHNIERLFYGMQSIVDAYACPEGIPSF